VSEPGDNRDDPSARVRQLLLSGDNIIKNRDDPERFARARERYLRAAEIAAAAGLPDGVRGFIDARLAALDPGDEPV
jgi:hypothetical protein